ncbi:MAG TPA: glutathione S-transferase family protein [Rhodopila sp.]|jgi:glutathione S-transferase|nr:glutathione S-transferase family protein [Rhodopila sp.]
MYTLYHAPGSSSMAVHIALHEVGVPFEGRTIDFNARDRDPPELRALNPEGKVPTLVIDGRPLTEVAAILYYLARRYPEAGLIPSGDIEAEARIVSWMSFTAATLHPARQRGAEHAGRVWRFAEQKLGANTWAAGAYSIADIHLFRLFWRFRGSIGADPATFPRLCGHYDRMMQRPAVRKTIADEVALGYSLPS